MPLTKDQCFELGGRLVDTTRNVYDLAEELYDGYQLQDADFEALEKHGGVFKCDECNYWKPISNKCSHRISTCDECAEKDDE